MTESAPNPLDPSDQSANSTLGELDREVLNDLTTRANSPGVYFGKGLDLSPADRKQLLLAADHADRVVAPMLEDPRWKTFESLIEEGNGKGVLISFADHPGTNVPLWCTNGGENALVRKVRSSEGATGIEVPSDVFNTYHWVKTIEQIRQDAKSSDELLKGRSPKWLGRNLRQLAYLLNAEPTETDE